MYLKSVCSTSIFIFLFGGVFSQNHPKKQDLGVPFFVQTLVELEKSGTLPVYQLLNPTLKSEKPHLQYLKDAGYYILPDQNILKLAKAQPLHFTQPLVIDGAELNLVFERASVFTPDFSVINSEGQIITPDLGQIVLYKGFIAGEISSWATLSIINGKAQYLIASQKGNYEINHLEGNLYAGYYSKNQINTPEYKSHTDEKGAVAIRHGHNSGTRTGNCIEVYLQCDYRTYQDLGSSTVAVTNWVASMINNVAAVYALHDVIIVTSQLFIYTTPDPYANLSNISQIRDLFVSNIANNYNGRIAHLLSTRALGGGIANGIGGFCSTYPAYPGPQCLSTGLSVANTPFPNYSFNTYVIAHEMGHVMGLRHTHACVWNNMFVQLDDCGNVYAQNNGQTPEGASCFDSDNEILPAGGGTIMSTCQLLPTVGINLNLGFGVLPGQLLYENFIYAPCVTGTSCNNLAPVNDICAEAFPLPVTHSCTNHTFTNSHATATGGVPPFTCGNPGTTVKDVWFKVTVPSSGNVTIETSEPGTGLTDVVIQAYAGTCSALSSIGCDDNSGSGNHALLTLSGRTPGEIIYIRLVDTQSDQEGPFNICAYDLSVPCHPDFQPLIDFYLATGGSGWLNKKGWQNGAIGQDCNVCEYYGVTCNELGRVSGISLNSNNLTGSSIPSSLANVTYLSSLRLYNNNLSGSLPGFFSSFSYLQTLDLGNNDFTGSIPSGLGSIQSLKSLYLDGNLLTGTLPVTLTNIDLSLIYVNNNNLSGCFPSGYSEFCSKAYNFSGNPNLAGGISFATYCSTGNGGDEDNDGFCQSLGDCNDDDPVMFPGNPEVCDVKDNNCNGLVDDIPAPQTNTWIGGSGAWNTPGNWSLGVVPQRCQNVVIGGNSNAVITLSSGQTGEARSVTIQSGRSLNIQSGATIKIDYGLNLVNAGSITNNGTITIHNILDNQLFGIQNSGTINNNSSANISIINSGIRSLSNASGGLLTNNGILTIDGNVNNGSSTGIYNNGSLINSGQVTIKNINGVEVWIFPGSSFTNQTTGILSID